MLLLTLYELMNVSGMSSLDRFLGRFYENGVQDFVLVENACVVLLGVFSSFVGFEGACCLCLVIASVLIAGKPFMDLLFVFF